MNRNTLAGFYWPITVNPYDDDYYDNMLTAINESFNDKSFDWYIRCMKGFIFNDFDDELKNSLIKAFADANPLFVMIENEAHLMILAQSIVYNQILNASDNFLAKKLSLAMNCMTFCYNNSTNKLPNTYSVDEMKSFVFREFNEENIKNKNEFSKLKTIDLSSYTIAERETFYNDLPVFLRKLDFLEISNKIMNWIIIGRSTKFETYFKEMQIEDAAFNIGFDFGSITAKIQISYPHAYIAKILKDIGKDKEFFEEKKMLKFIIGKITIDLFDNGINLNPLLQPLSYAITQYAASNKDYVSIMNMSTEITLYDFAIQIFCENILIEMSN
jgi:hypothetical protein